ncbi:unnamed protein product [Nesidiocoris tenuis]|uniref:Uncharacterized protein n=1 Tax=Nesidiocoris tenuis TaxID=355587 RepID=A0A6H5GP48_9HEMI|nr:unnamed protein product [Nesidiocoris tenuis]
MFLKTRKVVTTKTTLKIFHLATKNRDFPKPAFSTYALLPGLGRYVVITHEEIHGDRPRALSAARPSSGVHLSRVEGRVST